MALDQPITNEQDLLIEFLDPRVMESAAASPSANCKVCGPGGGFAQCDNCAVASVMGTGDAQLLLLHLNNVFLNGKSEMGDSDLLTDDFLHMGANEDPTFEALAVKHLTEDDPFFRFDDTDYLYTHQPDLAILESGSPSETVITRATSTNSLAAAAGYSAHNPMVKLEAQGLLSMVTLPLPLALALLDEHEETRKELAKVKFGIPNMNPCPKSIDVQNPKEVLDFLPGTMANMKYGLEVLDVPLHSRVETQIKLKFKFSPAPSELLFHVPQDLISKNKFCLAESVASLPESLKKTMLFMDTYVMTSDLKQSCIVCPRCIKREQKRALRLKIIDAHNSELEHQGSKPSPPMKMESTDDVGMAQSGINPWDNDQMQKKAIIYNCKEIVSFPPPTGLPAGQLKVLNMSARIICYCRHHKESEGFKLLIVVRDYLGGIVAKGVSGPIMIMDRKKTPSAGVRKTLATQGSHSKPLGRGSVTDNGTGSVNGSVSGFGAQNQSVSGPVYGGGDSTLDPSDLTNLHPLSPNSIDELTSDSATRGLKRKKLSYDDSYNSTGFLPVSNSDTNASVHTAAYSVGISKSSSYLHIGPNQLSSVHASRAPTTVSQTQLSSQSAPVDLTAPCIQKIIPALGPCRGGIEVTLLGYNFRPGLIVKFGAKNALATHCWSESTIVTYLPPCAHPGQVLVSFENEAASTEPLSHGLHMVFTYTDDTDRQLIELALQIVGLKMNGKLEDAKNIAKRIVGTEKVDDGAGTTTETIEGTEYSKNNSSFSGSSGSSGSSGRSSTHQIWYDNAHRAVQNLTRSNLSTQEILINFLSLVDLPNCPIIIPNWNLANTQGQTLLHLAALKNYTKLIAFLISHGTKTDVQDDQGLTPFFLALVCGHRSLMELLLAYRPNWNLRLSNDKHVQDYCDLNVLDVFERLEARGSSKSAASKVASRGDTSSAAAAAVPESSGLSAGASAPVGDSLYKAHNRTPSGSSMRRLSASDEPLNRSLSLDSLNSINLSSYGRHVSRMITESVSEERYEPMDSATSAVSASLTADPAGRDFRVMSPATFVSPASFGNDSDDFADSELDSDDHDDESDYLDYDYEEEESEGCADIEDHQVLEALTLAHETEGAAPDHGHNGLWSKMKRAVFALSPDENTNLPSYDDLFPFGDGVMRPKLEMERALNHHTVEDTDQGTKLAVDVSTLGKLTVDEDAGIASDSSEDLALSYINRPRKTVRNDKMLLFFWIPILFLITSLFMYVSITGYKVQLIEQFKEKGRNTLGNVMVGNERLARVFRKSQAAT